MPKRPSIISVALSFVLSALLLVQGAIPAGYMPASVDSGWLVMLCPEGLPDGFFAPAVDPDAAALLHAHHQSVGHDAGEYAGSDYCPLGAAVSAAMITELAAVESSEQIPRSMVLPVYTATVSRARQYSTSPRGPPVA